MALVQSVLLCSKVENCIYRLTCQLFLLPDTFPNVISFCDLSINQPHFYSMQSIRTLDCTDAFLIMYAIDDNDSYDTARGIMHALLNGGCRANQSATGNHIPPLIYLVGNKSDLVRGRQISTDGKYGRWHFMRQLACECQQETVYSYAKSPINRCST